MSDERWYFSKERLQNSPSRSCGISADRELNYKQLAANLIYDMGSRKLLSLSQLCINTAIVYMHRFYVFHSFTHFQWHTIAIASLFLAAKVEEQNRKIENIIKTAQLCLQKSQVTYNITPQTYASEVQELVANENLLLQTLGFVVNITHPHTFVVAYCEKIKLNKDITKTMYGMASNTLTVTPMCVLYKPTAVACFCIHFVFRFFSQQIRMKGGSQTWWLEIDPDVTPELLEQMADEFLNIYEKSPSKLKSRIQELLKCGDLSQHYADPNSDIGRRSIDSFCHSSASTSSSSSSSFVPYFASSSTSQMPRHSQAPTGSDATQGWFRVHRPSSNYLSDQQQSSRSTINTSTWSALMKGGIDTFTSAQIALPKYTASSAATRASSSQHKPHYHHRHPAVSTFSSSKPAHRSTSSSTIHHFPEPNIAMAGCSASTSAIKPDLQMANPPDPTVKRELDPCFTIASVESISAPQRATAGGGSRQSIHHPSGSAASDVIQSVSSVEPIAQHIAAETEPSKSEACSYATSDIVDGSSYSAGISKPSRDFWLFSPSPLFNEFTMNFEIPTSAEVSLVEEPISQGVLPAQVRTKPEPSMNTSIHQQVRTDVPFSDLTTDDLTTVATSAYADVQSVGTPVISNVVTQAPPSEVVSELGEYSELSSTSNVPLQPRSETAIAGECSTQSRKKRKKEKHRKEKKRRKDGRQRRHKEHGRREEKEDQHKKLEPIKITIPKIKLTGMPSTPELKIDADRTAVPSTSGYRARLNDDSENESKSLKRKQESDHDLSSD